MRQPDVATDEQRFAVGLLSISVGLLGACATTPDIRRAQSGVVTPVSQSIVPEGRGLKFGHLRVNAFACPAKSTDLKDCKPLPDRESAILQAALLAAWDVVSGPAFQQHVLDDQRWFSAVGNGYALSGSDVLELYPSKVPPFQIWITNESSPGERAHTSYEPPVIHTYSTVLSDWDREEQRAALIETLVHEITHLIAQNLGTGKRGYAFIDAEFSARPCKQRHLVSYKLGHMAHCTVVGGDLGKCMDQRHQEMATPWYTFLWSWTRAFCDDYSPRD